MNSYVLVQPKLKDINNLVKKITQSKGEIINVEPKKNEYSIDDIRTIKKEVYLSYPYSKIYLLKNFENSSLPAQNAFLKVLEEPPKNVFFFITVKSAHKLLPTILSRVKVIRFNNDKRSFLLEKDIKEFLSKWPILKSKDEAVEYLLNFLHLLKNCLPNENNKKFLILKEILKIKYLIEENNLNYQLAVDHVLILFKKKFKINL